MSRRSPFTVIELLTVTVIISILAALVLGVAKFASGKAHETKTLAKLVAFEDAVEQFKQDRGFFPSSVFSSSDGATGVIVRLGKLDNYKSGSIGEDVDEAGTTEGHYFLSKGKFVNSQTGGTYLTGYKGGEYLDGWGRPFLYQCDGDQNNEQTFDIWSAGRDGKVGTDDDVTNWKRN